MTNPRRRASIRLILGALVATAVVVHPISGRDVVFADPPDTRPNVVLIMIDDATFDEYAVLPKVQSMLAANGTTFDNFLASYPLCCPSSASFFSGQYNHNNGVLLNNGGPFAKANQVGKWLQDSGYYTTLIGKSLNGYTCTQAPYAGWTRWQALCAGVQNKWIYKIRDGNTVTSYSGGTPETYQTDVIADRAVATISDAAASNQPFLLWLTPTSPHGPQQVATRYTNTVVPPFVPTPSYNEADVSDKPAGFATRYPLLSQAKKNGIANGEKLRRRMNLALDDLVERVVNQLSATGELDNTIIVFTNDNGYMRGEHRISSGKLTLYNPAVRVGAIVRGPGFPAGVTNHALLGNVDFAPTIVGLAGATPGRVMDGVSILPATTDADVYENRTFLLRSEEAFGVVTGRGLKYVMYKNGTDTELYNNNVDPDEMESLHDSADYATVRSQLSAVLNTLKTCVGATCQVAYNASPIAKFTNSMNELSVSTDATTSLGIDDSIVSYDWDFGDGFTASGATAAHTYATTGDYTVTLTITDDEGEIATTTASVHANQPPIAAFTYTIDGTTLSVDGSTSSDPDGTIVSYDWDFGDANIGTGATVDHPYAAAGTYDVTLTVTDDLGAIDSETLSITL